MRQTSPTTGVYWRLTAVIGLLMVGAVVSPADAVPVQLLSARNASVPLPAGGDGDSAAPVISPDGRYVVFSSEANNLVPGGNSQSGLNVYLRDRTANTTVLVSPSISNPGGGNGDSMRGQVSTNGQFVVFQSNASDLVANDTNGVTDIFVRNLTAGTTALVSVAPDGTPGNGASTDPVMTPDGRYVAFISSASNLVAGDTNGIPDVFVRDLVLGTNYLVSVGAVGATTIMATPVMTPDGRYVAFFSTATNLVSAVPATTLGEVYVRDRIAGITTWASTNATAIAYSNYLFRLYPQYGVPAYHPRLSADGQHVVFKIGETGLFVGTMILRYDLATATTTIINTSTNGVGLALDLDDGFGPEMTPDGNYVVYVQREGASSALLYSSVRVWNTQTQTNTLISDPGTNGAITSISLQPVFSADDSSVAFLSNTTNLPGNVVAGQFHIYLRNLTTSNLTLVDVDTNGLGSTDDALASFSVSSNGQYVAFDSPDGGLVSGDINQVSDVFVRDLVGGTTGLISTRNATVIPQTGDRAGVSEVSVSTNGQWVAFASAADDLVPNDTNNLPDVFVGDLLAGTTTLVSTGSGGGPAWGGSSMDPVISGNGRYVVFISTATNLVAGQGVTTSLNLFRRDLLAGNTVLVSVSTNGVDGANGDCSAPVISQDGRYVAFLSFAYNLTPGLSSASYPYTYWRDITAGTTVALTNGIISFLIPLVPFFPPSLSSDGRYVAYSSFNLFGSAPTLVRVWDSQPGLDIYTNAAQLSVSNAVLSASGTRVLYTVIRLYQCHPRG